MPVPSIHRVGHAFDDRSTFLYVTLGAIATLHRLKEPFRRHAPPEPAAAEPDDLQGAAAADDDVLDLTLGLVSFSRTLVLHLKVMRSVMAGQATGGAATRTPGRPHGGLRQLLR